MAFDILITIFFTAIVQSIFGTGVLLFGTPILLILGYNFQYALIILLPTSILINFFQLKNNFNKIDIRFYKRLFLFSIPLIILFLYFTNSNTIRINFFVGIFLVIIALKENILSINRLIGNTSIKEVFKQYDVIKIRGDWTKSNTIIEKFLQRHKKFGIPFNIIYNKENPKGIVLSELLSESEIVEVLNKL